MGCGCVWLTSLCMQWVFGAYTNGAAVYLRERLLEIGPQISHENFPDIFRHKSSFIQQAICTLIYIYSEENYAFRVGLKYCLGELRTDVGCEKNRCGHQSKGIEIDTRPSRCNFVFTHMGEAMSAKEGTTDRRDDVRIQYRYHEMVELFMELPDGSHVVHPILTPYVKIEREKERKSGKDSGKVVEK